MFTKNLSIVFLFSFALTYNTRIEVNNDLCNGFKTAISNDGIVSSSERKIFLNDNFSSYYFSNLTSAYGNNAKGSCGFVATAMLFSFWNVYWDDNLIEEKFETTVNLDGDCLDINYKSPGAIREPYSLGNDSISDSLYYSNVMNYSNKYFHYFLIKMFNDNICSISNYDYSMNHDKYIRLWQYYLYTYKGYSKSDVEIIDYTSNVRNKTIELVKQGIPCKLSIGGHAVIAYDYDELSDSIYCHFGWDSSKTHVTIESQNYTQYQHVQAIKFNNKHNHSDNYSILNESGEMEFACPCKKVIPTKAILTNELSLDVLPTFKWDSLIREKWYKIINLRHFLNILDSTNSLIFTIHNIRDNKYRLTTSQYSSIFNTAGNDFYVYVGLECDDDSSWDDYYAIETFDKPNRYAYKSTFLPSDWGFNERYYFENELSEELLETEPERKMTTATSNGLTITTDRLRCGYIENKYIVLSPRRENAGYAYFEMNFDKPVYSFMYRSCLWSSKEKLDGDALLKIKRSTGAWEEIEIINTSSLANKENGLTQSIRTMNNYPIYGLRFEINSTATGDRNKGRFCIDDIVFGLNKYDYEYVSYNYLSSY